MNGLPRTSAALLSCVLVPYPAGLSIANLRIDGLFLTFGEFGPGDNIGLMAAKVSATCIRGQFYGLAAAVGKIGAFAGAYAFEDVHTLPACLPLLSHPHVESK
jgi:hypothetical protein